MKTVKVKQSVDCQLKPGEILKVQIVDQNLRLIEQISSTNYDEVVEYHKPANWFKRNWGWIAFAVVLAVILITKVSIDYNYDIEIIRDGETVYHGIK